MRGIKSEPGHYVATTAVMHKVKEFYSRQAAEDFAGSAGKVEFVSDLHAPATGQPGLWSHSVDPDHNVMKRYLVLRALYKADGSANGYLAMDSYDTVGEALNAVIDEPVGSRAVDQWKKW